jgi:hypothetical protein
MGVSSKHILSQGPVIAALARTAWSGLRKPKTLVEGQELAPSIEIVRTVPPLPRDLIDDYVRHLGGDPKSYRDEVPPHLFPQWAFPLAARTLAGLPYPLTRVVNGGCRMQVNAPVPSGVPLTVSARLADIDDDGKRAIFKTHVVTGTPDHPEALITEFHAICPVSAKKKDVVTNGAPKKEPREKPRVPADAHELLRQRLPRDAGLSFAKLTGDFNPIHWIPSYAKASGFKNVILHGFGTFSRTCEVLNRTRFGGDVHALQMLDVRFTRPLVLPAEIGFYVTDNQIFVGDGPNGPAYLVGTFANGDHK